MLKHLSDTTTARRSYPENPFAMVAAFEQGLMGLDILVPEKFVSTFSGFTNASAWGMMEQIPFGKGMIGLLHHGRHTSVLKNQTGDTLYWQSFMEAGPEKWYINEVEQVYDGEISNWYGLRTISWFIAVAPGETISISAQKARRSDTE
jgi:hypothetical protein